MKNNQHKIPEGWREEKLGKIGEINPPSNCLPEKFAYIDLESVEKGNLNNISTIKRENAPIRAQRLLKKDDILFQTVRPYQQNNLFFNLDGYYVASTGYAQIRTKQNPMFLYQYLHTSKVLNEVLSLCTGSNYPAINSSDLKKIKIIIPPLPEQNRIVSILETWNKYLENLDQKIKIKKNIKKYLSRQLLDGKIRLKGFNEEWKFLKLRELCDVEKGVQLNRIYLTKTGLYPAINGGVEPSGFTNKWNTEKGTVVISEGGNSCGYVNLINENFWSGGHCYSLKRSNIDRDFLYQKLKISEKKIMNLRVGSGLPNIQKKSLLNFKIKTTPNKSEQEKIANILTKADQEISALEKQREIVKAQKKYLLNNLITGQIRLPEFVKKAETI